MEFGLQFFPDVGPEQKAADVYWDECLRLCDHADALGYTNIRTVEHYFVSYGGYSPNPHIFLVAAAQRAKKARLVTGAVLPAFNHPLKETQTGSRVKPEIGMMDAITGGRMECGFARAFLPHEFVRFGVSMDESRDRFEEGVEIVRRLLEEENVSYEGKFHKFKNVRSLPRPVQKPRPPFWVAALATPESFERAGARGYNIMAIPMAGGKMKELIGLYRSNRAKAGHKGPGKVMLAFHMLCHEDAKKAREIAKAPLERYLKSLVHSASDWTSGASSKDYPGYDKIIESIAKETYESQVEKGAAWIGTPETIRQQIADYQALTGGFEIASLQVNFNDLPYEVALNSMTMFSREVMPHFAKLRAAAE